MDRIAVVDTMFARIDMGAIAEAALAAMPGHGTTFEIRRVTVPGFKDLAVACKRLIQDEDCRIAVALGMPGGADLDRQCAHEASMGIMMAQLLTNVHILEVFVHEVEGQGDDQRLAQICQDRASKHAVNAYQMLYEPEALARRAGQGVRQGGPDAGPVAVLAADLTSAEALTPGGA